MQENIQNQNASDKIKTILGSKKGLKLTFDAIPNLIAILDTNHEIVMVNRAMAEKLSISSDACSGNICFEVVHNTKNHPENCPHAMLLKDGLEHSTELYEKNLGGHFIVTASPIKDEDGNILGSIHVANDITARKKAEEKVEKHTEELAKSNAELEHFAYVASHDLREPLRMITSFLQLLERRYNDQLDEDANEFIGFAVDGAQRLNDMINDLLEYSRITSKKREFNQVNCDQVLKETLNNLKVQIDESNAIITNEPLPLILGDEVLISQLFQNIISNSIKYRSQEPPQIRISVSIESDQHCFSIKDNGIGIEKKHLGRIFTIFQRLHTQEEYDGTGLGLAIVQKIVNEHSGKIWAESEVGKGTTFYFTIPNNNDF
jgi:PAS domain S-box-containing protein